ncbi:MAG: Nif3-like dinuclear metal center hexameric protein [Nocardioidaceae bacterium]|nr:Nif3-like dinuclear metal center hexameric protein [Nocardioidaceae bacterium]
MPLLRDVIAALDALYDPRWADDWDAVGTVVGDPGATVHKVLFAVDPVQAVIDEAVAWGADLVVTHHPLYLKGVTTVAATTPKGKVVQTLINNGMALHTCHTNADSPPGGVSEAMALTLGVQDVRPLDPDPEAARDKWTVFVPESHATRVTDALKDAGAGATEDYDRASFATRGVLTFRPLEGSTPHVGSVGDVEIVEQVRIELVASRYLRATLHDVLRATHPYDEPAFDVAALASLDSKRGSGRIGTLAAPMTLLAFAQSVAHALPSHRSATRVAGDPDRLVRTVAVCGGSGDFLLAHAHRLGADVYVTSDLRHHPVSEAQELPGAPAVIDVPHWAAESTWLSVGASALVAALESQGATVETKVSQVVTDPWTFHI